MVVGVSVTSNRAAVEQALKDGSLPAGKIVNGDPLFFEPLVLALEGGEEVNWDKVFEITMKHRGDPSRCRWQKTIVEIEPDQDPLSHVDLAVSQEELGKLVGPEIASQMRTSGPQRFFVVSQYDSVARRRLNPLSIVFAKSMHEAASVFLENTRITSKQAVMVEPCCDILRTQGKGGNGISP